jgi:hypothetical protein
VHPLPPFFQPTAPAPLLHFAAAEHGTVMAEVLVSFDKLIRDDLGEYHARAVGRPADDGMWEGWIEFTAVDGSAEVLVTGVESRQPEREYLQYWATGLTPVFLEGALHRARRPVTVRMRPVEVPNSTAPKPRDPIVPRVMPPGPEPVLDPFDIGGRSLDILRQELGALNRPRLVIIIAAFGLNRGGEDLAGMSDRQLIQFIVTAVEAQLALRSR